jgi:hypothetical protein
MPAMMNCSPIAQPTPEEKERSRRGNTAAHIAAPHPTIHATNPNDHTINRHQKKTRTRVIHAQAKPGRSVSSGSVQGIYLKATLHNNSCALRAEPQGV